MADFSSSLTPPGALIGANRRARPGLIDTYLIRAAVGPFLLILFAVVVAMMLERALRLIHEMAATGSDLAYFGPLLLQLAPYYLDLAIPFAFMAAVALLVARMDERLELEAMFASGLSLARIAAPLMAVGLVVAAIALFAGGWLEPQGRYGFRMLHIEALNAARLGQMNPRVLYRPTEEIVLTFDRHEDDGRIGGMFLWQLMDDGEELVLSGGAEQLGYFPQQRLFAVDFNAGRYVAQRPSELPDQVEFAHLAFREPLRLREQRWQRGWDQKELTLPELITQARDRASRLPQPAVRAELYARLVRAGIGLLVPLLVLPLAMSVKRQGRVLGILLCAVLLSVAHHGLNFAKKLAVLETLPPAVAIFGFAALFAGLVIALFVSARHLPSHSPVHAGLDAVARLPLRLASRSRTMPGATRRTAARYLRWELGKWTLVALVTIVGLLQMVDLVERGDDFVERGMALQDVARYALLRLPPTIQQSLPIAALAGAIVAFALFAGRNEMTALRAAGLSQWRMLAMVAPVPLALMVATVGLMEWAVPTSQYRLATWWAATTPPARAAPPRPRWFRIGTEIVRAGAVANGGTALRDVRIFRRDASGRLSERVMADRAELTPAGWRLLAVETLRFGDMAVERRRMGQVAWPVALRPRDIAIFFAGTPSVSVQVARRALADVAPTSAGTMPVATRLYRSISEPLAPLAMLLFALPLAFIIPQQRSWPALTYAAGAGFVYVVTDGVLTVAAQLGHILPAAGSFAAPIIGIATGLSVLIYAER